MKSELEKIQNQLSLALNEIGKTNVEDTERVYDHVYEANKVVENLNLHFVSKQRELLIAAAKGIYPHGDHKRLTKLIDKYLQGN